MVGSASLLDVVAERLDSAAATAATATAGELRSRESRAGLALLLCSLLGRLCLVAAQLSLLCPGSVFS